MPWRAIPGLSSHDKAGKRGKNVPPEKKTAISPSLRLGGGFDLSYIAMA
jgi:hypothetical protein